MAYKAPVRDLTFVLNEVLEIDRYANQPGFADVSSELVGHKSTIRAFLISYPLSVAVITAKKQSNFAHNHL